MSGLPVGHHNRAVLVDVDGGAGFTATIEPIAGGDAAPLVLPERRPVARVVEKRLDGLGISIVRKLCAGEHLRSRLGGVLQPQFQRVHADLPGQNVEHAFYRKGPDRRARRTIGRNLWAVGYDVVADRARVRDVVGRKRAHARAHERRARKCASLQLEEPLGRSDRAVAFDADLHRHRRSRRRARSPEHVLATHHDLDGKAGFTRQRDGNRFDVDHRLAAESAADLRRIDAQVADFHAEQLRRVRAYDEMPLACAPELALAVGIESGHAALRLDIGLMHWCSLERHFDDLVGRCEAGFQVAEREYVALRDVRRRRRRLDAPGDHVREQQRRIRLHRLIDVDDVRQHLVVDCNQ